jgi:phosphatidylglycerol:prolipoprotein diacylglycerol transferase
MIPYLGFSHFNILGIRIYIWGLFAAFGFFVGLILLMRVGKKRGLNQNHLLNLFFWIMFSALLGSRVFEVFIYNPGYYFAHLGEMVKFWRGGMSSFGGLLGALAAFTIYVKVKKNQWIDYADALIYPLPLGLGIGRIGCFLLNEHPGRFTNFFLGVRYPDGARHDLGLEFMLLDFFIFAVLAIAARRYRPGIITKVFIFVYFPLRFFLEFLRADDLLTSDARYFYFTPAQWGSLVIIFIAAALFKFSRAEARRTYA